MLPVLQTSMVFYANVNPDVDHPRWTQASERQYCRGWLCNKSTIPTLMYNGYKKDVGNLYKEEELKNKEKIFY